MMKKTVDEKLISEIIVEIKKGNNSLSVAEISSLLGCSAEDAKAVLNELLIRYYGELDFNNESGVIYCNFQLPLKRRKTITLWEIFSKIFSFIFNVIIGFLKASIAIVMLALYFIYQIMPLVLGLFSKDKAAKQGSIEMFSMFGNTLKSVALSIINYGGRRDIQYVTGKDGEKHRILCYNDYRQSSKSSTTMTDSFSSKYSISDMVFNFVIGPPRATFNKKEKLQRVVSTIIKQKGNLKAGDLIELEGYNLQLAENYLLKYCEDFNGELNIENRGGLSAFFPEFAEEYKQSDVPPHIVKYYEEAEPPFLVTGLKFSEMFMIFFIMLVPTIMSFVYIFDRALRRGHYSEFFLFILCFTTFVYVMPLLRAPFIWLLNLFLRPKNLRRKLYKKIFLYLPKGKIKESKLLIEPDSDKQKKCLKKIAQKLKAETEFDDNGEIVYNFSNLYNNCR